MIDDLATLSGVHHYCKLLPPADAAGGAAGGAVYLLGEEHHNYNTCGNSDLRAEILRLLRSGEALLLLEVDMQFRRKYGRKVKTCIETPVPIYSLATCCIGLPNAVYCDPRPYCQGPGALEAMKEKLGVPSASTPDELLDGYMRKLIGGSAYGATIVYAGSKHTLALRDALVEKDSYEVAASVLNDPLHSCIRLSGEGPRGERGGGGGAALLALLAAAGALLGLFKL